MLHTFTNATNTSHHHVFTTHGLPSQSPLVLTWAHNGIYVPDELHLNGRPLGWPSSAFDPNNLLERRHEVTDWGMQDLLKDVLLKTSNAHVVSHISRLVADHNRVALSAITEHSDDTGEAIPLNLALTEGQFAARIRDYHDPYHEEIDRVVQAAKFHHGFATVLDMHSFTREFQGKNRDVCLGTIKPCRTPLSDLIESKLAEKSQALDLNFAADAPYNIRVDQGECNKYAERNAGQDIAKRNGIGYVGIEICNDLLICPERRLQIAHMVNELIAEITPYLTPDIHAGIQPGDP
jgi:predicted N-formylglutamate amidohydrolase